MIDFLGDKLRADRRGDRSAPGPHAIGRGLDPRRQADPGPARRPATPSCPSACSGRPASLDIDGLTIELVPVGGEPRPRTWSSTATSSWATPTPAGWIVEDGAPARLPRLPLGRGAGAGRAGARGLTGLARAGRAASATLEVRLVGHGPGPARGGGAMADGLLPRRRRPAAARARRRASAVPLVGHRSTGGPSATVVRVPPRRGPRGAPDREARRRRLAPGRRRRGRPPRPTPRPAPGPPTTSRTTPTAGCPSAPSPAIAPRLGARRLVPARAPAGQARARSTVKDGPSRTSRRGAGPGSSASAPAARRPSPTPRRPTPWPIAWRGRA